MTLEEAKRAIKKPDQKAMELCQRRWDSIAKPLHSLGKLEDDLVKIAGITGSADIHLEKKALVTMCADNGVVEEGVTQTGQEVTAIVTDNFLNKKATASILCSMAGADIFPVDIGVAAETHVIDRKIAWGTKNMTKEPAMTREEAIQALETGISMVEELKSKGYSLIATGEMGIGNTTTSAACAAVLFGKDPADVTGRGAGLSSEGLNRKINAIRSAIAVNKPDPKDAIDVIAKVGGLDIAGMVGCYLGAAICQMPILIDGFISAVSAYLACMLNQTAKEYMIPTHCSAEPAAKMIMEKLGMEAPLHAGMHLGEGTGAIMGLSLIDQALNVYYHVATFEGGHVEAYTHQV